MDPLIVEWLSLAMRWLHVMLGILWIGTSFFFIWLDSALRPGPVPDPALAGRSWLVHGGGFYTVDKFVTAPASLPKELHWFKYEAYFTWVSGFLLLALIYYYGAAENLIDPDIADLSPSAAIAISLALLGGGWILYDLLCRSPLGRSTGGLAALVFLLAAGSAYLATEFFAGRAAYVQIGAFLGSIMAGNVFFVIIPNQKKIVAALIAGQVPDPALGKKAKQRSLHNNYLTLPVVLMMVSGHYPMLYASPYRWLFVLAALVIGGLIRHYANRRNAGAPKDRVDHLLVLAIGLGLGAMSFTAAKTTMIADLGRPVTLAEVTPIVAARCQSCHSATPSDEFFRVAPKGIRFDTPEEIARLAPSILRVAVNSKMMPLRNKTGMTEEERALIGAWIATAHGN